MTRKKEYRVRLTADTEAFARVNCCGFGQAVQAEDVFGRDTVAPGNHPDILPGNDSVIKGEISGLAFPFRYDRLASLSFSRDGQENLRADL